MINVNGCAKQFFLYAKCWYKKSDSVWEDLSKLRAINYFNVEGKEERDLILNKVTQCAIECILENPKHKALREFQKLLEELSPNFWIRAAFPTTKKYDYDEALLQVCLSTMRWATVENLDPEKDCRFDILPSS